jgi:hypothetical protein
VIAKQIKEYEKLLRTQAEKGHLKEFQQAQYHALTKSNFIGTLKKDIE